MNYLRIVPFLFLTTILSLTSCSSSEDSEIPQEEARYYVKYEVSFKTQHTNTTKDIKFTTEKGIENANSTYKCNGLIGLR